MKTVIFIPNFFYKALKHGEFFGVLALWALAVFTASALLGLLVFQRLALPAPALFDGRLVTFAKSGAGFALLVLLPTLIVTYSYVRSWWATETA